MDNSEAKKPVISGSGKRWGENVDEATRREQFKLIYDYIKFHIGLYLATPAVIGLLGNSFGMLSRPAFQWGLAVMIGIFFVAGAHAAWFMGTHVNTAWDREFLHRFERNAFSRSRRILHHWMYWLGLLAGLGGLVIAKWQG
jgi:hypothetical protein